MDEKRMTFEEQCLEKIAINRRVGYALCKGEDGAYVVIRSEGSPAVLDDLDALKEFLGVPLVAPPHPATLNPHWPRRRAFASRR